MSVLRTSPVVTRIVITLTEVTRVVATQATDLAQITKLVKVKKFIIFFYRFHQFLKLFQLEINGLWRRAPGGGGGGGVLEVYMTGGSDGASYCKPKKIHKPEILDPKKYPPPPPRHVYLEYPPWASRTPGTSANSPREQQVKAYPYKNLEVSKINETMKHLPSANIEKKKKLIIIHLF